MSLIEAIQYIKIHKNEPLPIKRNDFLGFHQFGQDVEVAYKIYNNAISVIYKHKIAYMILKLIRFI